MSFAELGTGAVIRYPYLWSHRAGQGETEVCKSRPVVVGVRLSRRGGEDIILLFPITSEEPHRHASRQKYRQPRSGAADWRRMSIR
jgi:hypothetical protein